MMTPSKRIDSQVSQHMANNALQMDINDVNDAINFYNQMQQAGYSYAGWAKGVADGSTTTGRAALDHMQTVAEQELGRKLTDAEINDIRTEMAQGYQNAMRDNFKDNKYEDVDFQQTKDFHLNTFDNHGLTENAWTLTTPMNVIAELENMKNEHKYGEKDEQRALERQEQVWEQLRDTGGDGADALLRSYDLKRIVDDFSNGYGYIDDSGNIFSSGEVEASDLANYIDTDDSTYHLRKIEFNSDLVQGAKNWSEINTIGNSIGNLIGNPNNDDISDENSYNPYPTDDEGTPLDDNLQLTTPELPENPSNDDGKSWGERIEDLLKKPLEWLGLKDKDDKQPENQAEANQEEWNDEIDGFPDGVFDDEGTPMANDDAADGVSGSGDSASGQGDGAQDQPPTGSMCEIPGAGSGFTAGLGGGSGAGTLGQCNPNSPYRYPDPLVISLKTGTGNNNIHIISHDDADYQSKMLDFNGDGIANKVSWIGQDTGVLFDDANNNGQFDGRACNDEYFFQAA